MDPLVYFIAGVLRPVFWVVILSVVLWLVRRLLPPQWERVLFRKLW